MSIPKDLRTLKTNFEEADRHKLRITRKTKKNSITLTSD